MKSQTLAFIPRDRVCSTGKTKGWLTLKFIPRDPRIYMEPVDTSVECERPEPPVADRRHDAER